MSRLRDVSSKQTLVIRCLLDLKDVVAPLNNPWSVYLTLPGLYRSGFDATHEHDAGSKLFASHFPSIRPDLLTWPDLTLTWSYLRLISNESPHSKNCTKVRPDMWRINFRFIQFARRSPTTMSMSTTCLFTMSTTTTSMVYVWNPTRETIKKFVIRSSGVATLGHGGTCPLRKKRGKRGGK